MANNNVSLDALKSHLFETLEGVKNLSDPLASENEKVSLDQAKRIVDISGKIIEICKVQVDALKTFNRMENVGSLKSLVVGTGIASDDAVKQIEAPEE